MERCGFAGKALTMGSEQRNPEILFSYQCQGALFMTEKMRLIPRSR
jgi:hypothetical protein